MATPTLTSISPATGSTGGRTLVELRGSGFRLPPEPSATGPAPVPGPTVAVEVAGRPATDVRVLAAWQLFESVGLALLLESSARWTARRSGERCCP
jgi:hypothetical protein